MFMPTGDTLIRRTPPKNGWAGDIDSGEMFNNYKINPSELVLNGVEICGVEIYDTLRASRLKTEEKCFVWDRLLFGWCPAPFYAVCMLLRAIEMAKKTRYDIMSFFAWSHVELNLPSSDNYDPGKRRVSKI
jgi:hypothetical protein